MIYNSIPKASKDKYFPQSILNHKLAPETIKRIEVENFGNRLVRVYTKEFGNLLFLCSGFYSILPLKKSLQGQFTQ